MVLHWRDDDWDDGAEAAELWLTNLLLFGVLALASLSLWRAGL